MKFLALLLLLPSIALAERVQVLNTIEDFKILAEAARGKAEAEQMEAWLAFERKYQDLYDLAVFPKNEENYETKRLNNIRHFLRILPAFEAQMLKMLGEANELAERQVARFQEAFPDLREGTPVVFMPGLRFNGRVLDLPRFGRPTLLIGVDMVVERKDDINVLFSHEFFHIHHFNVLGKDDSIFSTMSTPLWTEGFATFVSEVLNPGAAARDVFMDPALAEKCALKEKVAPWAGEYLKFFDRREWDEKEANRVYAEWFLMSGEQEQTRRGYCLGYLTLKEQAKRHPLTDLVKWMPEQFIPAVGRSLSRLAH